MVPINEQNQHFAELRQKVCSYIHAVVLLRGLPSLEGKNKLFVGKKEEKAVSQTQVRQTMYYVYIVAIRSNAMATLDISQGKQRPSRGA